MKKFFLVEEGSSLQITLNRPEVGNAFHHEMILELTSLFASVRSDSSFKTVFLRGKGKHFCTGADLNWMKSAAEIGPSQNLEQMHDLMTMYETIAACPKPVITYVHGCVYGGGIGLCSLSDFVIAHPDSTFCLSEMKYGLLPGALTPFLLERIGKLKFMKLALEAAPFNADEAFLSGIVSELGDEKSAELIKDKFNELPALALTNLKQSVQLFMPEVNSAFQKLKTLSAECRSDSEGQKRMLAFKGR